MKNFQFRRTSFPLVISLIFLILYSTLMSSAQDITISHEFTNYNTKGYSSVLIPSSFPVNQNDEEVMAVGSILVPGASNNNSVNTALHLIRYNNTGQILVNKIIDDQNANERAVSICVYDASTFVIVSSYCNVLNQINCIKLTFIDIYGKIQSEKILQLSNFNSPINPNVTHNTDAFPLHAIMHQHELYICGALQNNLASPLNGLDFSVNKTGFVYNYNSQKLARIVSPVSVPSNLQKFTLAKRLRIADGDLYAMGMIDAQFNSSSPISPCSWYVKIDNSNSNLFNSSDINVLNVPGSCATDIMLSPFTTGNIILLSQSIYSPNYSNTTPTSLIDYTGIILVDIPTSFPPKVYNFVQIDNQIASKMYFNANSNSLVLSGWEQGFNQILPSITPYNRRDNSFLYEISYDPTSSQFQALNYYVFNNLSNNTQTYNGLGGSNLSNFHLLPDNSIERKINDGYIINALYKNNYLLNTYGYGLKTIFTNHIYSCDAIKNPSYMNLPFTPQSFTSAFLSVSMPMPFDQFFSYTPSSSNSFDIHYLSDECYSTNKYKISSKTSYDFSSISPNPCASNSNVSIKFANKFILNSEVSIRILNSLGMQIKEDKVLLNSYNLQYNLPALNDGLYFLNITNQEGVNANLPFLIN